MNDRVKIQEIAIRIDEVLYYQWDPIGVSNEPYARGEYSPYVDSILNHVINEDLIKIADTLTEIESNNMGLSRNKKKRIN